MFLKFDPQGPFPVVAALPLTRLGPDPVWNTTISERVYPLFRSLEISYLGALQR
jgi:hypothetical protein